MPESAQKIECDVVVVNKKQSEFDLAVDRHYGSGMKEQAIGEPGCLGNPWKMDDTSSREDVVGMFTQYWIDRWQSDDELRNFVAKHVKENDELRLGCHCAPKLCHGDVIKRTIEMTMLDG